MFQFPGFAPFYKRRWSPRFTWWGCPIRTSADHLVCANPRSFSQLIASFIASESLGIPRVPLITSLVLCPKTQRARVTNQRLITFFSLFFSLVILTSKNVFPSIEGKVRVEPCDATPICVCTACPADAETKWRITESNR